MPSVGVAPFAGDGYAINVAVNDVYGEADALAQALRQLFGEHDRTVPPPRAADADRQVAFALPLKPRQTKLEQLARHIQKFAGAIAGEHVVAHRWVRARQ